MHFKWERAYGRLQKIIGHDTNVSFFAFQCLVISFLVFFAGFGVKTRIASHLFSKKFILSQSFFFLKVFKALILFNIIFIKTVKQLFYLRTYFEDFIKNTICFTHHLNSFAGFLWSYRIWAYLREINIKRFWYFWGS